MRVMLSLLGMVAVCGQAYAEDSCVVPPDLSAPARSPLSADALTALQATDTPNDVVKRLGPPNRVLGSGPYVFVWSFADGRDYVLYARDLCTVSTAVRVGALADSANGKETPPTRSMITSKVGSGGISGSSMSRGYGYGTTTCSFIRDEKTSIASLDKSAPPRSRSDVDSVFRKNCGALLALYSRAVRDNENLRGRVSLQMTISAAGDVTDSKIIASELRTPDLERKLEARTRLFRFDPVEFGKSTVTLEFDFKPEG